MVLQGMHAVITGGAGGLGRATARAFLEAGAAVVIADRDAPAAQRAVAELAAGDRRLRALACDITDAASCQQLVREAEAFFGGPLDIFLAHAGRPFGGPLLQARVEDIRSVIDTNVTGTILSAQAALPSLLRSRRQPSLLFTGSLQSVMGRAERSVYTASKHAIAGLVKALALEFGPQGVRVNGIAPTLVDTPFLRSAWQQAGIDADPALRQASRALPLGRIPTPEDFAAAAVYLASPAAAAITGHLLMLDCGASAGRS
jgi:NAD(P)-dependent dehydrogenase (short-subunit alcohol dehydrogenase family)